MICEKKNILFHDKFKVELRSNKVLLMHTKSTLVYVIHLNNNQLVDWKAKKQSNELKAFGILINNEWQYFYMQPTQIELLKQFLDGKVQYRNINSLHRLVVFSGKGSFGQVFKYQSRFDQNFLACKSIKIGKYTTFKEFEYEITALQNLKHPKILKLKEFYIEPRHFYIVTEFLEGGSLADLMRARKLNDEEILTILKQLLSAVNYIHEEGYVYRDMKQQNIMFAEKNNIDSLRLIDLGLTIKQQELHGLKQQQCGTPGYMAPEIASPDINTKSTFSSDIFGIGVLLWEMIHQRNLITGKDLTEKFQQNRDFEYSKTCVEQVENTFFRSLLEKMLQSDPSKRIESSQALELVQQYSTTEYQEYAVSTE